MRVFDGFNHSIYVKGHKLDGVSKITVDGDKVHVDAEYAHTGMGSGDCIGISTSTYSFNDVQIRRVRHELYS